MPSIESSSPLYMDESELDLGLGLSLGGGKAESLPFYAAAGGGWNPKCSKTMMVQDFVSSVPTQTASSSSSSSVTGGNGDNNNGSSSPSGRSGASQVVGWPPIRSSRVNSLVHHTKSPSIEDLSSTTNNCTSKVDRLGRNYYVSREKGSYNASFFIKVNMDGFPIGRKVDMNAHNSYETLVQTLDAMFSPGAAVSARRSNVEKQINGPARLLGGSSDMVLTYQDKDGDWMLVGDVPWEMFLSSVKRLRIMRTTEAYGRSLCQLQDVEKQTA